MFTKKAEDLQPGDRIITNRDVETVTARTGRGSHGTCSIHTRRGDITTTLPCDVNVVD